MVDLRWNGPCDLLELGIFRLPGPLVFTSCVRRNQEPSAISTLDVFSRLKPAPAPAPPSDRLTYTTVHLGFGRVAYERLSKLERWNYLTWHQEGRPALTNEAHLLLFLQGLERRALVAGHDIPQIWTELWRLWSDSQFDSGSEPHYEGGNYTFRRAAEQLLWLLLFQAGEGVTGHHVETLAAALSPWTDHLDRSLSLLLAWCLRENGRLPAWMAFHCARLAPGARGGVVLERASEEMRQLFDLRFQERWKSGLSVTLPPKARRSLQYDPYNPSLNPTSISWLDPLGKTAIWKQIREELLRLYTGCHEEIRPLALALGKAGVTRNSMIAWEATPKPLRSSPPPASRTLWQLGGQSLRETGYGATTIAEVAAAMGIVAREALPPDASKILAASIQRCQLAIEPDARLTGKGYKWSERCVLFRVPDDIPEHPRVDWPVPAEILARYGLCAALLRLAFLVTHAGGTPTQENLTLLAVHFKAAFEWDIHDTRRFKALAGLLLHYGVDTAALRVPSGGKPEIIEGTGQLLLKLASYQGQVSASQEDTLRLAWKRLGLDGRVLTRHLDELSSRGVIFLGKFQSRGRGEALPAPPQSLPTGPKEPVLQLNYELIATLREETRRIQGTLTEAMSVGEEGEKAHLSQKSAPSPPTAQPAAVVTPFLTISATTRPEIENWNGLEPRFVPLLETLVGQDFWPLSEVQSMARKQGIMLSGAIEAINDWAFEALGGALLWEDDDDLMVERSLLG